MAEKLCPKNLRLRWTRFRGQDQPASAAPSPPGRRPTPGPHRRAPSPVPCLYTLGATHRTASSCFTRGDPQPPLPTRWAAKTPAPAPASARTSNADGVITFSRYPAGEEAPSQRLGERENELLPVLVVPNAWLFRQGKVAGRACDNGIHVESSKADHAGNALPAGG
jgi:hypothetical protein